MHVLRDRLRFVSLLFPNNPCSEPFHLYSCEILVQGQVGRSRHGIFLKRLPVRVIGSLAGFRGLLIFCVRVFFFPSLPICSVEWDGFSLSEF